MNGLKVKGVMEQLKVVRFKLEERLEVAILLRTTKLKKKHEANNVSSLVDMASDKTRILLTHLKRHCAKSNSEKMEQQRTRTLLSSNVNSWTKLN